MTNTIDYQNPEYNDPDGKYAELNEMEFATALAVQAELSSILNRFPTPTNLAGRNRSRTKRKWAIVAGLTTCVGATIGAMTLNPNGPTALAAQYTATPIPQREPHYAPVSLPANYFVNGLERPDTPPNPVAQTMVLANEIGNEVRDYTTVDLLGSWAVPELTRPPQGTTITMINNHRSWESIGYDPNWLFYNIELDCGTATILVQAPKRDAALRRLGALRCDNGKLQIEAVDNLSLLYNGPPYAMQNDSVAFTLSTPSANSAHLSIGWSSPLPIQLAERLKPFVPENPISNEITINGRIGHLAFDAANDLFRVEVNTEPEPDGAIARIAVAGKVKDEVLAIARAVELVSDERWKSILDKAGLPAQR
jgi:hypothetical protein